MKRIISFVLSVALIVYVCPNAFAAEVVDTNDVVSYCDQMLGAPEDNTRVLISDFQNGDTEFVVEEKGVVTFTYFIDRSENTLYTTEFQGGNSVTTVEVFAPQNSADTIALATDGYEYMGCIGYDVYSQGYNIGPKYLDIQYQDEFDATSTYDITGTFRDRVALAAKVAMVLSWTGVVSSKIAMGIMNAIGLAPDMIDFVIPPWKVDAEEYQVTWRAEVVTNTAMYYIVEGSEYLVTLPNGKQIMAEDDDYYPRSMYTTHNTNFALMFATHFYGGFDLIQVSSWE